MTSTTTQELRAALDLDLRKTGPKGLQDVVDDAARKTFSARIDGAILEFAHKQSDRDFWTGVKYYGSGSNSRVRIPRAPQVVVAKVKAPAKRKARVAAVVAEAVEAPAVA